jgi:hypothetical protein
MLRRGASRKGPKVTVTRRLTMPGTDRSVAPSDSHLASPNFGRTRLGWGSLGLRREWGGASTRTRVGVASVRHCDTTPCPDVELQRAR